MGNIKTVLGLKPSSWFWLSLWAATTLFITLWSYKNYGVYMIDNIDFVGKSGSFLLLTGFATVCQLGFFVVLGVTSFFLLIEGVSRLNILIDGANIEPKDYTKTYKRGIAKKKKR